MPQQSTDILAELSLQAHTDWARQNAKQGQLLTGESAFGVVDTGVAAGIGAAIAGDSALSAPTETCDLRGRSACATMLISGLPLPAFFPASTCCAWAGTAAALLSTSCLAGSSAGALASSASAAACKQHRTGFRHSPPWILPKAQPKKGRSACKDHCSEQAYLQHPRNKQGCCPRLWLA